MKLRGAAGVTLSKLDPTAIEIYLRRDAGSASSAARWDPVVEVLHTTATAPAAKALRTPLMVGLARTIYNPRPGEQTGSLPNPADLCDTTRFPTPTDVERHLFNAFIPAAYRPHPDPAKRCRWPAADAQRWLINLATHLEHVSRELLSPSGSPLPPPISRQRPVHARCWPETGASSDICILVAVATGPIAGVAVGLVAATEKGVEPSLAVLLEGTGVALTTALVLGLTIAFVQAAWGSFTLARCWLALGRRLPWRLTAFLADAHEQRGVLRQVGAFYQFRHIELQWHLATL